jgi:hypothetical protein
VLLGGGRGKGAQDGRFEVHRRSQVPETTIRRADKKKRCCQDDPTVVDVEFGVGRDGVADDRILFQIRHRIPRVAEIIDAQLVHTVRRERIDPGISCPQNMAGPAVACLLRALQSPDSHRRGQGPQQPRTQSAGRCFQIDDGSLQG